MDKEVARQVVLQQKEQGLDLARQVMRENLGTVLAAMPDKRVLILTGPRRSGKSVLLGQIMRSLKKPYCYVNFDDERFLRFPAGQFQLLDEVLTDVYGPADVYFFDEVQNIEKWETFVRRLQDQGRKVVITGSNASLLSQEFGTRLTGRHRSFTVFPFSFREYLVYTGTTWSTDDLYLTRGKVFLKKQFDSFLETGGMPEFLRNRDPEYLHSLFGNILYRDIIARYGIKNQVILRELASMLVSGLSTTYTYNALAKALNLSNAITVKEYVARLQDSYLFFELLRFGFSVKKQLNAPKKAYLVDHAFHKVLGHLFSPNSGRILENIVHRELKRDTADLFYFNEHGPECDFVVKKGTRVTEAIQVCWSINRENREREFGGLVSALKSFHLKKGLLLTYETEGTEKTNGLQISLVPVWRWLLERDREKK